MNQPIVPQKDSPVSLMFLLVACSFVTTLLLSNLIAGKIASFSGIPLPAAVILFPVTYILGDLLTEVYGFRKARLVIWLGLGANLLMVSVFAVTLALPHPAFWHGQAAYTVVLGMTPRVVFASMVGYLAGELSNAMVLALLKVKTKGKFLWVRTIGSTVVGEGIDTVLFIGIVFWGIVPATTLGKMMVMQYLWKVGYESAATPLTYLLVGWVKRKEQRDVYDDSLCYEEA